MQHNFTRFSCYDTTANVDVNVSSFSLQIVIVGDPGSDDTKSLLGCVRRHFLPNQVLLLADNRAPGSYVKERLAILRTVEKKEDEATAYVCENFTCSLPTNSVEELEKQILGK